MRGIRKKLTHRIYSSAKYQKFFQLVLILTLSYRESSCASRHHFYQIPITVEWGDYTIYIPETQVREEKIESSTNKDRKHEFKIIQACNPLTFFPQIIRDGIINFWNITK